MSLNNLTAENRQNTGTINNNFKSSKKFSSIKTALFILICLLMLTNAFGQTGLIKQYTGNTADQNLHGSGRINLSTLGMEFDLSLGGYAGRGVNIPINLSYSSKVWNLKYGGTLTAPGHNVPCWTSIEARYAEKSASGWTTSLAVPYIEYSGWANAYNGDGTTYNDDIELACDPFNPTIPTPTSYFIRRITLHLPSGETHELRLNDTPITSSGSWNGTYYAADSSNIKYIEDSVNSVYKVLMPDGSFYTINHTTNQATTFTDRNGNYTTYHAPDSTYLNGYWTDTLGRNIPVPIKPSAPSSPTTDEAPQTYSIPGIDGDITYKFHWKYLKGSSSDESGLTNFSDSLRYKSDAIPQSDGTWDTNDPGTYLFASEDVTNLVVGYNEIFNPIVLTQIDLPTGEKYKFRYNVYGELDKIDYPTGGEELFVYNPVDSVSVMNFPYSQASRGVTSRKVYETAGSGTHSDWTYDQSTGGNRVTNPDGTQIIRFLHVGNVDSYFGYDNVLAGMPYRELSFSSSGQLQTQKLTYWTKSSSEWHPRVVREDNIIYNSSGDGLSSTAIYDYEGDLSYKETPVLVNKTTQYAFVTSSGNTITSTNLPTVTPPTLPSAPSTPVRISESTYLINDSNYSGVASYYTNQNINGLVTISKVKKGDGTTVVAQSETVYDEYGYSPNVGRGNPTTAKVWDSTKGAVTSSGAYISTHAKFDSYGNQYETSDALGNVTTTEYDDTYYAFPVSVTTAAPDQSGGTYGSTTGFTSTITYDSSVPPLGLVMSTTDINGQTTTMEYDEDTLRPTSVTAPNGQVTEYEYGVPNSTTGVYSSAQRFIKVRTQIDSNNWKEGYSWVDGLGRSIKGQSVDSSGDVFAETEYDIMGRTKRSTNPYRTGETKQWTTPTYDDMGRTTVVTSPDSTTVQMSYGISTSGAVGVTKTVTDQAGRKRKGITDALGNMIRVIEDPDSSALETDYVFDTLGNLRKTTQGSQYRYFMHDSLGRLLYAKQPEQDANSNFSGSSYTDSITSNNQWSVKYVYDDNSNITSTTDARNKTISATYDHLNRLILRDYSDSSMADVTFYYDGKGLSSVPNYSKGKVTNVSSTVSGTRYTSFDNMGRILTSEQRTTPEQLAFTEAAYTFSYVYNLSGALIEETYPSGRKVKNTLNADGELSMVQSKKNSTSGYFIYAMGFEYNSSGALKKMRFGNGHWENYTYNNRQQVTQIGLGTLENTQDLLKLDFDYGMWESGTLNTAKNNGSLAKQTITVPTSGSDTGFTAIQSYTYDSLNRLQSAAETVSSTQTWKQTFSYDRYGNRRFDTSGSNTTTIPSGCSTAICNPTIDTSNNRFSLSGQSYTYDADGNLTQDATGKRFGYDTDNRQKEFFSAGNSSSNPDATYYYDGEGRRVKKISGAETTIFVYDAGGQLAAEYSTALADTQQVSYLTADHLGSVRAISNEIGQVVKRQDYSAFGDETVTSQRTARADYTADKEVRQDYTGYQKDNESGLEYAQARYYNSSHGRFTSVDPLTASATIRNPQSFNRYSYVLNSPYKFTDPLGLLAQGTRGGGYCGANYSSCSDEDSWIGSQVTSNTSKSAPQPLQGSPGTQGIADSGSTGTARDENQQTSNQQLDASPTPAVVDDFLTNISEFLVGRDGSSDGAPSMYPYLASSIVASFKKAVEAIEKEIDKKLLFTEMFRPTEYQKQLYDKYLSGKSSIEADVPGTGTHEAGFSFDIKLSEYTLGEQAAIQKIFADNGFIRNVPKDIVHFTYETAANMRLGSGGNVTNELKNLIQKTQNNYKEIVVRRLP